MQHKSDFNSREVEKLLSGLSKNTRPLWGIMTPQHAVEHLTVSVKASVGKTKPLVLVSEPEAIRNKQALIATDGLWPKGLRNALLPSGKLVPLKYGTLEEAENKLVLAVKEFEQYYGEHPDATHPNPFLGRMDYGEWLQFHFKHFRHHFIQFGLLPDQYAMDG